MNAKKADWWQLIKSNPLRAIMYALIFILGVQPLLSLSEFVVKAKGFVLEIIEAYHAIWLQPLRSLFLELSIPWPTWASDLLLLWAVSNAAGYLVTRRLRQEIKEAQSHWQQIKAEVMAERMPVEKLAKELTTSEGIVRSGVLDIVLLDWPRYYYLILPIVVVIKYVKDRRAWAVALEETRKQLNPNDDPELDEILEISRRSKQFASVFILRHYAIWIVSLALTCCIILVISYALFYIPVST